MAKGECPVAKCPGFDGRREGFPVHLFGHIVALELAIDWALGEHGDFGKDAPDPDKKPYPRFWWRKELRLKRDAALCKGEGR